MPETDFTQANTLTAEIAGRAVENAVSLELLINSTGYVTTPSGRTQPTWDKLTERFGWAVVGNFTDGCTVASVTDLVEDDNNETWRYIGGGSYPITVAASTPDPTTPDVNWQREDVSPDKPRLSQLLGVYIVDDKAEAQALGALPVGTVVRLKLGEDAGLFKAVSSSIYADTGTTKAGRFITDGSASAGLERISNEFHAAHYGDNVQAVAEATGTVTLIDQDLTGSILVLQSDLVIKGNNATLTTLGDFPAIRVVGTGGGGNRFDNVEISDGLTIIHAGATTAAITTQNASYFRYSDILIDCVNSGLVGIQVGESLPHSGTPAIHAFMGSIRDVRIRGFTGAGVVYKSAGSQLTMDNVHSGSTVDGAHGAVMGSKGFQIKGGQLAAPNIGGYHLYIYNNQPGEQGGGVVMDLPIETVAVGEIAIFVGGDIRPFNHIDLIRIRADMSGTVEGTVVKFDRTKNSHLDNPKIDNSMGGATLLEWGEDADDCILSCDKEAAKAPIVVHASALRPLKKFIGVAREAELVNYALDDNLRTEISDGMDGMPDGFIPVHTNGYWNYIKLNISNNSAQSFTPPSPFGKISLMTNKDVITWGSFAYDVSTATGEAQALGAGANFEVTTGTLDGINGVNNKVNVAAGNDGKIYVAAQRGSMKMFMKIELNDYL